MELVEAYPLEPADEHLQHLVGLMQRVDAAESLFHMMSRTGGFFRKVIKEHPEVQLPKQLKQLVFNDVTKPLRIIKDIYHHIHQPENAVFDPQRLKDEVMSAAYKHKIKGFKEWDKSFFMRDGEAFISELERRKKEVSDFEQSSVRLVDVMSGGQAQFNNWYNGLVQIAHQRVDKEWEQHKKEQEERQITHHAKKEASRQLYSWSTMQVTRKVGGRGYNITFKRVSDYEQHHALESPKSLAERVGRMAASLEKNYPGEVHVENHDFRKGRVVVMVEEGGKADQFLSRYVQNILKEKTQPTIYRSL